MKKAKFKDECADDHYEIYYTKVRITLCVGIGKYLYKEVDLFDGQKVIDSLCKACATGNEYELDDTWYN